MTEYWRDIVGYEGKYQVSNLGNVKTLSWKGTGVERLLTPVKWNKSKEYLSVHLTKNGKRKKMSIHRLVAMAFLPNPLNLPQINHKDENQQNNIVYVNPDGTIDHSKSNLEWCDNDYNVHYGTGAKRAAIKRMKQINQCDINGNVLITWRSIKDAGKVLNINPSDISAVLGGKAKTYAGYKWCYNNKTYDF